MSRALIRADSGTSIIEFALMAPVMIFLLVGLIEIGRFAFFAILAANAARAGVQYGAQSLSTADDTNGIKSAALQDGQNLSNWTTAPGGITVSQLCAVNGGTPQSCGSGTPAAGTIYYVSVNVTGYFNSLLKYPGIPSPLPISGSAIMRLESQ